MTGAVGGGARPKLAPRRRWVGAALCLLLLSSCVAAWSRSIERRSRATSVGQRSGLARRQPSVFETAELMESDDAILALVAESLLDEQSRAASGAPAVSNAEVKALLLDAAIMRPGAAHYRLLIGRSVLSEGSKSVQWDLPLALAALAAPGLDTAPKILAERYLEKWPDLDPGQRARATATLGRAFLDASFVRSRFLVAESALGEANAVQLLPADEEVLETALEVSEGRVGNPATDLLRGRLKSLRGKPTGS